MALSKAQIANLDWGGFKLSNSVLESGTDDGVSVERNQVAEVATAEVEETDRLSEYAAIMLGQSPDAYLRTAKGKPKFDGKDDTDSALPDGMEYKFVSRRKGERGGKDMTEWISADEIDAALSAADRTPLPPQNRIAPSGRVVCLHARNQETGFTFSLSNSTFKFPAQGGN